MKPLILGTRGSDLALAQTRLVAARLLAADPGIEVEERIIRTTGDARLDVSLSSPGPLDKGLFTRELEDALLRGEIDAAVHSLKDLPADQPAGLVLGAILEREEPGDVLVSRILGGIDALPPRARVATSSLRRKCFLHWRRPDLDIVEIRGNVPTRIRKLVETPALTALVLADAGLRRLRAAGCPLALDGLFLTALDFMLPAPGQGAIALECRADDSGAAARLQAIHHTTTAACVAAERAILSGLGGGCHLPLGALARLETTGAFTLRAAWFGGDVPRMAGRNGAIADWPALARAVAEELAVEEGPR
ncbi:MAG: hydroxymethylbilane synthase [Terrimicrobiaceae bacterium]|nr:hydroxymethylbilane synthase [Terrimicrobiaceae bacterium]